MKWTPVSRREFSATTLVAQFPAKLSNRNKQLVYRLACAGRPMAGSVDVSRWATRTLPTSLPPEPVPVVVVPAFYAYSDEAPGDLGWYVNFADAHLFGYYGGPLLAQDELQVAEHPVLASVREALVALNIRGLPPLTTQDGFRTPILVRGAERRCRLATDVDAAAGRPDGLYGNRFARADLATVERAVTVLDPPTLTNLIAMEAPSHGSGLYRREQLLDIVENAFTGFSAARQETVDAGISRAVVHTGFWGCGAFGGNRVLMIALQILAARLAGIAQLVVHAADPAGPREAERAVAVNEEDCRDATSVAAVIDRLAARHFEWGTSDGN